MVWDAGNDVGMMNYIFLYIIICSVHFIIFSLGVLGVSVYGLTLVCRTARRGHNIYNESIHLELLGTTHQRGEIAIEDNLENSMETSHNEGVGTRGVGRRRI